MTRGIGFAKFIEQIEFVDSDAAAEPGDGDGDPGLPDGFDWFTADVGTFAFYTATTPSALYDPVDEKTWLAYEAWNGSTRLLRVCTYHHPSKTWAGPYTAIVNPLSNDDHGVPAIGMDPSGYVHMGGAAHGATPLLFASTTNPRDPSAWTSPTSLANGTYPHPYFVGSSLFMFYRHSNLRYLSAYVNIPVVAGVPTFSSSVSVGDMGASSRWYQGNGVVVGTDIHMLATYAPSDDTIRQDVYYLIYDTVTGAVRNFDGSVSVAAGSLPILRTTLNASFRIVDQTTSGAGGNIPQMVHVDGVVHVAYMQGTGTDYRAFHICNDGSGWTAPLEIGAFATNNALHRYDAITITAGEEAGSVEIWWLAEFGSFTRGGKVSKRKRFVDGSLGTVEQVKSPDRAFALDPVVAVKDGHPDMRAVFAESSGDDTSEQQLRAYVAGDRGIVQRPIDTPAVLDVDFTTGTYNGANFAVFRAQAADTFAQQAAGPWTTFAANTLRRTDRGLLVEPAATNLALRSRTLENAAWFRNGVNVTANQAADADGTTSLELVNRTNSATYRRCWFTRVGTPGVAYAFAVNVKAGTFGVVSLRTVLGSQVTAKKYDIATGVVSDISGTPETAGFLDAFTDDCGGGIRRVYLIVQSPGVGTDHQFWICPGDTGVVATGTIYAGAVNIEEGTVASSHIPTVAAAVTRPADDIYVGVPTDVTAVRYVMDDDSEEIDPVLVHGAYKIPTNLTRRYIKSMAGITE